MKQIIAAALAVCISAPAWGQGNPNCAPREQVLSRLVDLYGESRRSVGLAANNTVVELFSSAETRTWTITVTLPSGLTCLVAAGQNYEAIAPTPQGERM